MRLLLLLIFCLALPIQALACACCSNDGDYQISFRKPHDYELGELERFRFAKTAVLFTAEADLEEHGFGISRPQNTYLLTGSLVDRVWKFAFRAGPNSGVLELPLPEKLLSYAADIHDGRKSAGGGPLLYKEWRFEGPVKGSGVFKDGTAASTKYFLVFQGRGNACGSAEDFTNWRLEVTGEKARYAFYGKLLRSGK